MDMPEIIKHPSGVWFCKLVASGQKVLLASDSRELVEARAAECLAEQEGDYHDG